MIIVSYFFWIFQIPLMYSTFFPCLVGFLALQLVFKILGFKGRDYI